MTIRIVGCLLCAAALTGCSATKGSDTARTGTEMLLISDAVDQSLSKVDFRPLAGSAVFLDDSFADCVDKNYVVSSVRHRIRKSGAVLVGSKDDADVVLELRTGAVGTDRVSTFFGVPEIALPGPMPVSLPEVKLVSKESQFGTAKIGLVAYDARTNQALGDGGISLARANDSNWYVLGMGPWKEGDVKQQIITADREAPMPSTLPDERIVLSTPGGGTGFAGGTSAPSNIQLTNGSKPATP